MKRTNVWETSRVWVVVWKACCEHRGGGGGGGGLVRTWGSWRRGHPRDRTVPAELGKHKVCCFHQPTHSTLHFTCVTQLKRFVSRTKKDGEEQSLLSLQVTTVGTSFGRSQIGIQTQSPSLLNCKNWEWCSVL